MKMQSLAVIFAIIIIPIVIAVSIYINIQEDTLTLQTSYDTKLHNATYDAIKAFQLNELNSNTQNIATEKIRDIEASVQTFYNSLAMSLNLDAFGEDELGSYIPALAYTLYDGYYIYSAFYNIETGQYERGLKPYIYYSARYQKSGIDITVNYTLDNYVTIYGYINGEYITKSGYIINPSLVTEDNGTTLRYKGHLIEPETLREINTETYTNNNQYHQYKYTITENNQRTKIYLDGDTWYRFSVDRRRIDLTREGDIPETPEDNSAYSYYKEAKVFSEWVINNLGKNGANIKLGDAVGYVGNENSDDNVYFISPEIANESIFNLMEDDPEDDASIFNEHRRNVIKYAIQTNLNSAIAGYNQISQVEDTTYNFKMPILQENDWDSILNNVSLISFMQGFPIKGAYYNGYSIVTNNENREFVDPDFIYFSNNDGTTVGEYHSIYDYEALSEIPNIVGYRNIDFGKKKISVSENENDAQYFYAQYKDACYNCIITTFAKNNNPNLYVVTDSENNIGREKTFSEYLEWLDTNYPDIAKAYYTAIAREKYSSYKSNKFE